MPREKRSTLNLNVGKMDPPGEEAPGVGELFGGFEVGGELIGLVGPCLPMIMNIADEEFKTKMRINEATAGMTLLLDFGKMGVTTLWVENNMVKAKGVRVDNPTLEVDLIGVEPDKITDLIFGTIIEDLLGSALPLIGTVTPVIEPFLRPVMGQSTELKTSGWALIRGVISAVIAVIPHIPRMILSLIPVIPTVVSLVLPIVGGLFTRKVTIKGRIYPILPVVGALVMSFLMGGEQDIEFIARQAEDLKEFGVGPPAGWDVPTQEPSERPAGWY
jgi:hypothetical protein